MPNDKEVLLETLRTLDNRVLRTPEELWEVARLYNVKKMIHKCGHRSREVDKTTYNFVRDRAIDKCLAVGGATADQLCLEIEKTVRSGRFVRAVRFDYWECG